MAFISIHRLMRRLKHFENIAKTYQRTVASQFRNHQPLISEVKKECLKDEIKNYVDKTNPHEYELYAVVADAAPLTFIRQKVNNQLGERFTAKSSVWHFPYYNLNDRTILFGNEEVKGIGDYSSNIYRKGYEVLQQYARDEIYDEKFIPAFTALEGFYTNREIHERSLRKLKEKLSETDVSILMTNHLLSQLLYHPTNYFLDVNSVGKPAGGCPCECGSPIQYGSTNIGSPQLFYGRADLIMLPSAKNIFWNNSGNSSVFQISSGKDGWGIQRLSKEWNLEEELEDCEELSQIELKSMEQKIEKDVTDDQVNQICKQAIAVSLWKHKKRFYMNGRKSGSGQSMIPVCLLNKTRYMMVMYNAEYDYLLRMENKGLALFENEDRDGLNFSAIIDLWLMIYHSLFSSAPSEEDVSAFRGTCNLAGKLGDELFIEIVKSSKFDYALTVDKTSRRPKDVSWNRSSCPVPTCTTEVWKVKRLHPFPANWSTLQVQIKSEIMNELELSEGVKECCSVCLEKIIKKIHQRTDSPELFVPKNIGGQKEMSKN